MICDSLAEDSSRNPSTPRARWTGIGEPLRWHLDVLVGTVAPNGIKRVFGRKTQARIYVQFAQITPVIFLNLHDDEFSARQ
jgi:hypothetical protein